MSVLLTDYHGWYDEGMTAELTLSEGPRREDDSVVVEYADDTWQLSFRAYLNKPVDGPIEMTLKLRDPVKAEDSALAEGITTGLLRSIPMRDVKKQLSEFMLSVYESEARSLVDGLSTGRFGSDRDYALLAIEFIHRIDLGDPHPVRTLAEQLHVGRNTLAARVRTARAKGLLTPEDPDNPGELTDKAKRLLKEGSRG